MNGLYSFPVFSVVPHVIAQVGSISQQVAVFYNFCAWPSLLALKHDIRDLDFYSNEILTSRCQELL